MSEEEFELKAGRLLEDFEKKLNRITEDAERDLKKKLITNHGKKIWLSKFEAGGILNWSPQTVMSRLPHYDTTENGGSVRFLLSDIEAEMEKRKIKQAS